MDEKTLNRFKNLFDSYQGAYGTISDMKADDTGKVQGRNIVIRSQLQDSTIERHLNGKGPSIRLIPLKENCKLRYAAIDLDSKCPTNPLMHTIYELEEKIKKLALPLIPCQSKSGDVHLYCFAKEDIDAKLFMARMSEWASLLGYGASEKFPKQISRVNDEDIGNALNIPYYGADKTDRFAIRKGKKLNLVEFLDYAEISQVTKAELKDFIYESLDGSYNDAPPCLQMMALNGVEDGGRNNGLFSFAVYYKKKYPDNFEEHVMKANGTLFTPALNLHEVSTIIKSVNKKDFFYRCNEAPCVQHCNKIECNKRKFGIGNFDSDSDVVIDNLTKYSSSDSVRWYLECGGQRIQLTTEELWNYKLVSMKIFEKTGQIIKPIKNDKWITKHLKALMRTCEPVQDPEDASKKGQFISIFTEWLENKHPIPKERTALRTAGVYHDEKAGQIMFRSPNLFSHLKHTRFTYVEHDVWQWIREDLKGKTCTVRAGESIIKCWQVPSENFYNQEEDFKKL